LLTRMYDTDNTYCYYPKYILRTRSLLMTSS